MIKGHKLKDVQVATKTSIPIVNFLWLCDLVAECLKQKGGEGGKKTICKVVLKVVL